MARPKSIETTVPDTIPASPHSPAKQKILVKVFQMIVGVDLIGSKMSMAASKTLELELVPWGVKAYSKASHRSILIPWTNIKGVELMPEST